jgi:hypothetical protein
MIYTSMILMFLLAATTVYVLIITRHNFITLFFLTPVLLITSIYAGYTVYILQGTPINGIPSGDIKVVWVEMAKPDILFLARGEAGGQPLYYRIPYTKPNAEEMQRIKSKLESDQESNGDGAEVTGKFTTGENAAGELNVQFIAPASDPLPPKDSPPPGSTAFREMPLFPPTSTRQW